MARAWDPIDHLLALDPGQRGIAAFFTPGGARAAAQALRGARRVLIATGFAVAPDMPETDGPPGAAVLGHALALLGARVRYVTDPVNVRVLEAAVGVLARRPDIAVYPEGEGAATTLLRRERPTHMIAIERPGRSRDGDYLNARGASVAAWHRPIDELFVSCRDGRSAAGAQTPARAGARAGPLRGRGPGSSPVVTIGVGDGGNEIGMGNVGARLRRLGPLMARIAAVIRTDHLVVSGVSNWGAYGIAAALGQLAGRPLLHTPGTERRLIEACVAAGAVDGLSRRRAPTVDALPLDVHLAFVRLLEMASGIMGDNRPAAARGRPPRPAAPGVGRRKGSEP